VKLQDKAHFRGSAMQNGIAMIVGVTVVLIVVGYLGYQNKHQVKMCETDAYKAVEATGNKTVELTNAQKAARVMVPCEELKANG
jgi:predicted negative regulator of RcsB-dependent stress response